MTAFHAETGKAWRKAHESCHIRGAMNQVTNDVQENVRRFNQEEAVWRRYQEKREQRRRRFRLRSKIAEELLDRLDWFTAGREMRRSDCVGKALT